MWEKADEWQIGSHPIKSIVHANPADALKYACQDADVQGRVWAALEQEKRRKMEGGWKIPEGEWDR
jgi:hypothetical protein